MPRYSHNVIKCRAHQWPGEIRTVPEVFAFTHDHIELARYATKRRGGRSRQGVYQFLLTGGGDPFRLHSYGIANAFILGVPAGLMSGQIGLSYLLDRNIERRRYLPELGFGAKRNFRASMIINHTLFFDICVVCRYWPLLVGYIFALRYERMTRGYKEDLPTSLSGRIVIVTGSGAGIGLGVVEAVSAGGARVVVAEKQDTDWRHGCARATVFKSNARGRFRFCLWSSRIR